MLFQNYVRLLKDLKKRKVYMRGNIFVKCSERGLTDPFKEGLPTTIDGVFFPRLSSKKQT